MVANGAAGPESSSDDVGLTLITEIGDALNRSSYPVPLVRQTLTEISEVYRREIRTVVFATYLVALEEQTGKVAISTTGGSFRLDQIAATEALVRELRSGAVPLPDAVARIRAIAASPSPVHPGVRILGYALMALGFAMCFRMSLPATAAAVALSIPAAALLLWSSRRVTLSALMPFLLTFASALIIALWAIHGGMPDPVRLAVIPVVMLIPGAAVTTAVIELTAGEMITGATRLISAVVMLLSMAFGLALAIEITGLSQSHLQDITANQAPYWVLWIAGPVFGLGNILYLATPPRMWGWTILFAFGTFWINNLLQMEVRPAYAGGIAMGVALIAARAVAARMKGHPSFLVMYLPSFWLMVPGSLGFVALSGDIVHDSALASLGGNAALSLLSMAICMMIASVIAPVFERPIRHGNR